MTTSGGEAGVGDGEGTGVGVVDGVGDGVGVGVGVGVGITTESVAGSLVSVMSPCVAVAEMFAVPAERPLTWAVARPSVLSLVMSATVATVVSLESKPMPRPRMVRLNWSKARAVKRATPPASIVCEGGSMEMPMRTEARSTKKAPSALTPGENLLAGAAAV